MNRSRHDLFGKLISLMEYVEGQNNFEITHVGIRVYLEGIEIHTFCRNEYGGDHGNNDYHVINWERIPNWVMRKLVSLDADYCTVNTENEIDVLY